MSRIQMLGCVGDPRRAASCVSDPRRARGCQLSGCLNLVASGIVATCMSFPPDSYRASDLPNAAYCIPQIATGQWFGFRTQFGTINRFAGPGCVTPTGSINTSGQQYEANGNATGISELQILTTTFIPPSNQVVNYFFWQGFVAFTAMPFNIPNLLPAGDFSGVVGATGGTITLLGLA